MARQIEQLSEGLVRISDGDALQSGVTTNIGVNSFALRKLAGQKRKAGWLVTTGRIGDFGADEWVPGGFVEYGGFMFVYGPYISGRFLLDVINDESEDWLEAVRRVAEAMAIIAEQGVSLPILHTRGILLLDDGGVFFLPPDIVEVMRGHQTLAERLHSHERYNHPDKNAPESYGFFLAALAYQAVTGLLPFDGDDEEQVHARARLGNVVAAEFRRVGLRSAVSDQIHATLSGSSYEAAPEVWNRRIAEWRLTGLDRALSDEERVKAEVAAKTEEKRIERVFQRKEAVRRNGRRTMIIVIITAAVLSIPGTIIYNALQPRATAGFTPEEVIVAYYTSINALDHMVMEDATVDKAGEALIREVTNLFVIDRQRVAVEMVSSFVDAQQWRESGMPTLGNGQSAYGVAYLAIASVDSPESERWFEVAYERWTPNYESEGSSSRIIGFEMVDQVRLRLDRDDWVVYQIDELRSETLNLADLRAESAR